jgi:hypothetical protein
MGKTLLVLTLLMEAVRVAFGASCPDLASTAARNIYSLASEHQIPVHAISAEVDSNDESSAAAYIVTINGDRKFHVLISSSSEGQEISCNRVLAVTESPFKPGPGNCN